MCGSRRQLTSNSLSVWLGMGCSPAMPRMRSAYCASNSRASGRRSIGLTRRRWAAAPANRCCQKPCCRCHSTTSRWPSRPSDFIRCRTHFFWGINPIPPDISAQIDPYPSCNGLQQAGPPIWQHCATPRVKPRRASALDPDQYFLQYLLSTISQATQAVPGPRWGDTQRRVPGL